MPEPILRVENLRCEIRVDRRLAYPVDDVSFEIARGETLSLVGESGCGKSLTALALLRLLPSNARIASGRILLGEADLATASAAKMRRMRGRRIAIVFQEPQTALNPVLTIGAQIAETLRANAGLTRRQRQSRAVELLELVGIADPAQRYFHYPHQLSGGMKQRAMIAMAIAADPDVLVADEPTTALDVTIQAQILDLLNQLRERSGMAMLLITHDLGVVSEIADRVALMYAGQIVEQRTRSGFFDLPGHPYARKLFKSLPSISARGSDLAVIAGSVPGLNEKPAPCRFAPRCDHAFDRCWNEQPGWHSAPLDGAVRCHLYDRIGLPPAAAALDRQRLGDFQRRGADGETDRMIPATPLLQVSNLSVAFAARRGLIGAGKRTVRVVDDIDLTLSAGTTLALVGESGCGKTTVGKSILGLIRPHSGSIKLDGTEIAGQSPQVMRQMRRRIQIIFQDPFGSMDPRMTVGQIVEEGIVNLEPELGAAQRRARAAELLGMVGLPVESVGRYPHEFSGGQRQRICIARAIAVRPSLIVCDEVTSALDVSVQAQILNLLRRLQTELGVAYLFISHNLSVVKLIADHVAVMYLGRIVERGPALSVFDNPSHPYTQALLAAEPRIDAEPALLRARLEGEPPSILSPPSGCHFQPRCVHAMDQCRSRYPEPAQVGAGHFASCFLHHPSTQPEKPYQRAGKHGEYDNGHFEIVPNTGRRGIGTGGGLDVAVRQR